jgi:ketosteroid isomerase-like protein
MSQDNVEIVRGMYEAYAHRDGVTPFERYSPDVEWDHGDLELVGGDRIYRGHDGVGALFRDALNAFREFEFRAAELTPAGDHVLVAVDERSVGRASGVVVDSRHYAVWTLHDGMVTRVRCFRDRADALKAAGLED